MYDVQVSEVSLGSLGGDDTINGKQEQSDEDVKRSQRPSVDVGGRSRRATTTDRREDPEPLTTTTTADPTSDDLATQLEEAKSTINDLQRDKTRLERRVQTLQKEVETARVRQREALR